MKAKDRITGIQMSVLISSALIGVGIITLPRVVTEGFNVDGGLATLIAGIAITILLVILSRLMVMFPRLTIIEISEKLLGKIIGKLVMVPVIIYGILVTGWVTRAFADANKLILLRETPLEIIMLTFILLSITLVQHGINPLARLCEIFFPIFLVPFILVLIVSLPLFNIEYLYPTLSEGIMNVVKVMPPSLTSYLGFEIILFLTPFMVRPKEISKYAVYGMVPPVFLYTITVVIAIGVLGIEPLNYIIYPTFFLAKSVQFPGGFAERFDIFFLFFWMISAFTTVAIYYYISTLTLTRTLGLINYRPFCYFLLPAIYLAAIYPENFVKANELLGMLAQWGGLYIVSLSLLLMVIAIIRKGVLKNV